MFFKIFNFLNIMSRFYYTLDEANSIRISFLQARMILKVFYFSRPHSRPILRNFAAKLQTFYDPKPIRANFIFCSPEKTIFLIYVHLTFLQRFFYYLWNLFFSLRLIQSAFIDMENMFDLMDQEVEVSN